MDQEQLRLFFAIATIASGIFIFLVYLMTRKKK